MPSGAMDTRIRGHDRLTCLSPSPLSVTPGCSLSPPAAVCHPRLCLSPRHISVTRDSVCHRMPKAMLLRDGIGQGMVLLEGFKGGSTNSELVEKRSPVFRTLNKLGVGRSAIEHFGDKNRVTRLQTRAHETHVA